MIERGLGKSGLRVSAVGLGCMGMSEFYKPEQQMDDAESMGRHPSLLGRRRELARHGGHLWYGTKRGPRRQGDQGPPR